MLQGAAPHSEPKPLAWLVLSRLLSTLLFIAAGLKGQYFRDLATLSEHSSSRLLTLLVLTAEVTVALWLLLIPLHRMVWWASLSLFVVFALISGSAAMSGQSSCGCFGYVKVHPIYTLLFDLAAVIAVLLSSPSKSYVPSRPQWVKLTTLFGVGMALGILGSRSTSTTNGILAMQMTGRMGSSNGIEVLEPTNWVGKMLPILKQIDVAQQISIGDWTVVLYRVDCSHCEKLLTELSDSYQSSPEQFRQLRVVLLEVPPAVPTGHKIDVDPWFLKGKLNSDRDWVVMTPVLLHLKNAKVQHVEQGLDIRPIGRDSSGNTGRP